MRAGFLVVCGVDHLYFVSVVVFFFFQAEDGIRDKLVIGVQTCAFFFQAEDGIRDKLVTGVQTCALPILPSSAFIVGFPGETKAAFSELKRYLTDMEFDRVGVFLYSDEEGTPAADLDKKIDRAVMEERRAELLAVQEQIALKKSRRLIGNTIEVMVEGISEETELLLEARHQGQAPEIDGVVYLNDGQANSGDFVKVEITDAVAYDLVGRIVG